MRKTATEGEVLFEFAVLADTHLGPVDDVSPSPWKTNRLANGRAKAAIADINARKPAFVVHLGDMIHPVPAHPDHMAAAGRFREIFSALEAPLHLVPGNHDIGDKPTAWSPAPAVDEHSLRLYEQSFGRQFYSFDHGGIHFTVVNNTVFNSGLPVEKVQWEWLEKDLSGDKRTFLFTHYPLYLLNAAEEEHAENIAEPARSRFLDVLRENAVEAVFTAHVHNFFYDADGATEFYVSPAMSAVRHDYAELFSIPPADEFGRNDTGKLGYFWVEVRTKGHAVRFIRVSESNTDEAGAHLHSKTIAGSRVGIDLRNAWAQPVAVPITGALDEFGRKWVRNDYMLSAVWEMGTGWLRVPTEDIFSREARSRMHLMRRSGLRFTVFAFGLPSDELTSILLASDECYDRFEIVLPGAAMAVSLPDIAKLGKLLGKEIYLSRLRTSTDEAEQTGRYAHFIDCGFHLEDSEFISKMEDLSPAIDGLVFRTRPGQRPSDLAPSICQLTVPMGLGVSLSVRMSGPDPATHSGAPEETAALVRDAVEASYGSPAPFDIVLDTLIDVDRGYFPRHGLLDRRYNHTQVSRALIDAHRLLVNRARVD